jgi:hypothetical protein
MSLRKNLIVCSTVVMLATIAASPAAAQLSAFAGVNFPTGDFSNGANTGWQLGAAYDFPIIPIVKIGAWGAYNRFGLDGADGNFNAFELMARGKLSLPIVGLYGWLGMGLASSKLSIEGLDNDRSTDFVYALGAGWGMGLIDLTLTFHQIGGDPGTSNFFTLGAGVSFP